MQRTVCTLRKVSENLWVSDRDHAIEHAGQVHLIVDCLGDTSYGATTAKILRVPPTGRTGHRWTVVDLDRITSAVLRVWPEQGVLLHCRRGVSRSATAAAAVLLAAGKAASLDEAVDQVRVPGEAPSSHSVRGLREWWVARQAKGQQSLPF